MTYKLHYSTEALNDLDEIQEYIEMELCNPSAALNVIDNILDTVEKLKIYPDMGTQISLTADIESDYRFVVSGNYMAFYRHVESDVYIDRVLYGQRNYLRILFGDYPFSEE